MATIIRKGDNPGIAIVLDNIMEFIKGDSIRTSVDTYYGFHTINFRSISGHFEQWDYGKTDEGKELRDKDFERIINAK